MSRSLPFMTKPEDIGKDPEEATIYASFIVYGQTFTYDQKISYVPTTMEGIDARVLSFFRNAYAEARQEARMKRFMEFQQSRVSEHEARERRLLDELTKKYAG